MFQIKGFFIGVSRYVGVKLINETDGTETDFAEIDTQKLIALAKNHASVGIRYVSVKELRKRKEVGVPEALIQVMEKDENLDVLSVATAAFDAVTGYHNSDIFGYREAIKYWKENKEEIEKKLKKPEDNTEKPAS